jgi:hypothetical protein
MPVSTQNPETELLPEDFSNIDRILAVAEAATIVIAVESQIKGPRIERWRWDVPEVRTSWDPATPGDVFRNVVFLVEKSSGSRYLGRIDINAWRDGSVIGMTQIRRWKNSSFLETPVSEQSDLTKFMKNAFATVSGWGVAQLDRGHVMAWNTRPSAFPFPEQTSASD